MRVGFLRMKVPFALCSVKTFAAQGSIPGLTFPLSLELLTVGAIARKWVLRKPVPTHQRGSPKISAIAREARSDSILICENIFLVSYVANNPSNGKPFSCKYVCQPSTPNPNALPFSADLTELWKPTLPFDFCINSSNTPSRNQVASYIKLVPFHSSYLAKFNDDKQQTKECDSSVCSVISLHIFVICTFSPCFL